MEPRRTDEFIDSLNMVIWRMPENSGNEPATMFDLMNIKRQYPKAFAKAKRCVSKEHRWAMKLVSAVFVETAGGVFFLFKGNGCSYEIGVAADGTVLYSD